MKDLKDKSRYISLLLRHHPEKENLKLDKEGWCSVSDLCNKLNITEDDLDWIVDNNDKKRFGYNTLKTMIRANQGHSADVKINYKKCYTTPAFLYHGTSITLKDTLLKQGIKKMSRTHVHLSPDSLTATQVGKRKDKNIILLKIDGNKMIKDGFDIFISENGVYLTDFVPAKYISL